MVEKEMHLTLVDGLIIALSTIMIYEIRCSPQLNDIQPYIMVEPFLITYCLFRILFSLSYKWTTYLLVIFLSSICARELFLGFSQLLQNLGTVKAQEVCVGSFSNSGPFGCFLAMCSSLFMVVYIRESNRYLKLIMILLILFSSILMLCTLSRTAVASFLISMSALALKSDRIRLLLKKYWACIVMTFVLIGAGGYLIKKPSADGRLLIARVCLRMIKENSLTGVGLGHFEGAYGDAQSRFFSEYLNGSENVLNINRIPDNLRMVADCPSYAFNEYLHIGVECGLIAMILLIGLMLLSIIISYRSDNYWCYPLITFSICSCFSYPFEIKILLLFAIVSLSSIGIKQKKKGYNICFFSFMIAVLGIIGYSRKEEFDKVDSTNCLVSYDRLFKNRERKYFIPNGYGKNGLYSKMSLFYSGLTLSRNGIYAKSDSVLNLGQQMSSDPMFWNVMGNNSLAQGLYREAEARYIHAFYMLANLLYPLYLLAKLYYSEGDRDSFLKMADIIESFHSKVESVNTERLRSEIRDLRAEKLDFIQYDR